MASPTKAQMKAYAKAFASAGGKARAKALTKARRQEISRSGGAASWKTKRNKSVGCK